MADNRMDSQEGVDNLNVALAQSKGGLSDMTEEQLKAMGGERDDLDNEDLSAADRGDDFDPTLVDRLLKEAKEREATEKTEEEPAATEEDPKAEAAETAPEADPAGPPAAEESVIAAESDAEAAEPEKPAVEAEPAAEPEKPAEESREGWIPLSRFNEVNQRRKTAEAALATKENETAAAEAAQKDAYDFEAAERAFIGFTLDGKEDDAVAKRSEINAALLSKFQAEALPDMQATAQASQDKRDIDVIIANAEKSFAAFDPKDAENYSEDAIDEVTALFQSYQIQGHSRPDSFELAVDAVARLHGLENRLAPAPAAPAPAEPAPADPAPIQKTTEKIAAAQAAPPVVATAGEPGDAAGSGEETLDISQMSEKEMEALPESTIARLRGDFVD